MRIKIGDYEIVQSVGFIKYDLHKLAISKKGKKYYQVEAYSVTMERCIQKIIDDGIDAKSLDEFLAKYKAESERVLSELKSILRIVK